MWTYCGVTPHSTATSLITPRLLFTHTSWEVVWGEVRERVVLERGVVRVVREVVGFGFRIKFVCELSLIVTDLGGGVN